MVGFCTDFEDVRPRRGETVFTGASQFGLGCILMLESHMIAYVS
jgi:hypothetical protein